VNYQPVPSLFENSVPGRRAWLPPESEFATEASLDAVPAAFRRASAPALPELSQLDVVRHYTNLARRNIGIDSNFYPLGSCTMKLNPWINEEIASNPDFASLHPACLAAEGEEPLPLVQVLGQLGDPPVRRALVSPSRPSRAAPTASSTSRRCARRSAPRRQRSW
jgi:hypothetical protein